MKNLKFALIAMSVLVVFSCKKEKQTNGITCIDIDGNVYRTVTIGTQIWMAENLKTTRYNDGAVIPTNLSDLDWENSTSGAYAIYNNDIANNTTYGKLYNWYAVNTGKLAPTGWHVATDAEWTTLTTYLGGLTQSGGHMKSTNSLWTTPNTGADNSSGFSGLPGGYRTVSGPYIGVGNYAYWWSSTGSNPTNALYRSLDYNLSTANSYNSNKANGLSIRCVRD